MTGRSASTTMDGTPISQTDIDRMEVDERLYGERQRKAARVVAAASFDSADCRLMLEMLGLDEEIVAAARLGVVAAAPSAA